MNWAFAILWAASTAFHIALPDLPHLPIWGYTGLLSMIYLNKAIDRAARYD